MGIEQFKIMLNFFPIITETKAHTWHLFLELLTYLALTAVLPQAPKNKQREKTELVNPFLSFILGVDDLEMDRET